MSANSGDTGNHAIPAASLTSLNAVIARRQKMLLASAGAVKRPVTTQEALDIFAAAGFEPRPALILALLGQEALGFEWATTNMAPFLDALIAALPNALAEALGEDIAEIRPRWGAGTARMIAKSLAEHVAELSRRETAFGLN